ncbi:MAG: hypothetical protein K5799_10755 [Erythrobacter sp.]|nr:hypothetical protein [Erythrobacter sp.]
MNISFSLPTTIDATAILHGLPGANAAKSGDSEGSDGFAELLKTLAAIVPTALVDASAQDDRQDAELPTGKILPVALQALPEGSLEEPVNTTPESQLSAVLALLQGIGPVTPLPVPTPANSNPVAPEATQARALPRLAPVVANPSAATPIVATLAALPTANLPAASLEPAMAAVGKEGEASPLRQAGEMQVRITAAARPVEAGVALPVKPALAEALRGERPGAAIDAAPLAKAALTPKPAPAPTEARVQGPVASAPVQTSDSDVAAQAAPIVNAAPTSKQATAPTEARAPIAMAAAPSQALEGKAASDAERPSGDDGDSAERPVIAPRATNASETARPSAPLFATQVEDAAPALRPVAITPRPIATDPFADVERVVEHLMAARQTDLSKPAAIAVAHREFGALTVTFAHSGDGMNVEIAAETNESQRALAAAMAQDRGPVRAQDTAPQPATQLNQPAPHTQDRSASGSQNGTGFAQGQDSGQSHGDNSRSQNSDPRGRHGGTATPGNSTPARTSSDDALYA